MKLHLASANSHKVAEFTALAAGGRPPVEIVAATAVGGMPAVVEDAGTFAGNARKKARVFRGQLPFRSWVVGDDSGLCVAALDGAPGVDSAYYAGPQGDSAANLRKLVEAMRGVPANRRQAHFVCVLVVIDARGHEYEFEGRCEGHLCETPAGSAGFGYDPLFVPAGRLVTFAELTEAVKNKISHRGRAWAQLAAWLRTQPGID